MSGCRMVVISAINTSRSAGDDSIHKEFTETEERDLFLANELHDLTISLDNAVSTAGETKFKLKITNKTNDYVLYKPFERSL